MLRVAIIGATGAVGREMIKDLEDSSVKNVEVGLFASARSAGQTFRWRNKEIEVQEYTESTFKDYHYALMSAGSAFSKQHAMSISDKGTWVIDNSSAWRMHDSVPLVVPEVNGPVLDGLGNHVPTKIIANPNCSTIQMVLPLKVLDELSPIKMVQVATYQSVSGAGQEAIDEMRELARQEIDDSISEPLKGKFNSRAFNCIPAIDKLAESRHSFEEEKMVRETQKILGRSDFPVLATTVRVPVFRCHGEAVSVQLTNKVTRDQVVKAMRDCGFLEVDDNNQYETLPTPRRVQGEKGVWVSRLRLPLGLEESDWVQFWVIADNLKKGASTNAVQILEYMEDAKS